MIFLNKNKCYRKTQILFFAICLVVIYKCVLSSQILSKIISYTNIKNIENIWSKGKTKEYYTQTECHLEKCITKNGKPFRYDIKTFFPALFMNYTELDNTTASEFIIATAVSDSHCEELLKNIYFTQIYMKNRPIILYDLGLSTSGCKVHGLCNVEMRHFNFSKYPEHVKDLKNYAWKPLIISECLEIYPGVLWMDTSIQLDKTINHLIDVEHFNLPNKGMLLFHGSGVPSFAVTHHGIYQYIPTNITKFKTVYNHGGGFLMLYKTQYVILDILRWLVLCCLEKDCISPKGALLRPCHFNEDQYAGCHRYDQAVINLLLANHFQFNESLYTRRASFYHVKRGKSETTMQLYC